MKPSFAVLLAVSLVAAGILAGATGAIPAPPRDKKITVCLLPKKKGLPYFTTCAKGAEEAAKELGNVELIYDGPTDVSGRQGGLCGQKDFDGRLSGRAWWNGQGGHACGCPAGGSCRRPPRPGWRHARWPA